MIELRCKDFHCNSGKVLINDAEDGELFVCDECGLEFELDEAGWEVVLE